MTRQFGGTWTERKLDIIEAYLRTYLTAMRKQKFSLGYVDAFAGAGSITLASRDDESGTDVEMLIRGSAQRAIELEPGFDGYVLIESDREAIRHLEDLKRLHPGRSIQIREGDANAVLTDICMRYEWDVRRAVVFLDPAGMQVEWSTTQALASTGAMDVWIWFPLGVGVNRLLTRSGVINPAWGARLDSVFGTDEWRSVFYKTEEELTLFGIDTRTIKIGSPEVIASYYNERLKTIFPAVAPNPTIMRNSRNNPMYLLCFASANPGVGGRIAVKIAAHLLSAS